MALANPVSITYGDFTAGGGSGTYMLLGPYVIEKSYQSLRLVFDVLVAAASSGGLGSASDELEAAFAKRDQSFSVSIGGSTSTYTHGTDALNVIASTQKSGDRQTDRGTSRAYTCVIECMLPQADREGLRDLEVNVDFAPGRQRTVSMRGSYTSQGGISATTQYATNFDAEATTILAGVASIPGAAANPVWELVDEQFTRDRLNQSLTFTRQYVELLVNQSESALNDTDLRDHRIVFTDLSQHPGDGREKVYRMRRVVGNYSCAISLEETTDLQEAFDAKVRPHVIKLFDTTFTPKVFAIEDSRVSYDETSKRMDVALQFLYQKEGGEDVVEVSQSVAYREARTIDYTPLHDQNELAMEADVGWASVERVWSRTVVVIGEETPKRRIGVTPTAGPAGLFTDTIGGEAGVDGRSGQTVNKSGWNMISNTSQVTEAWIGDPTGDEEQIRTTTLTETVVERFHLSPTSGGGTTTPFAGGGFPGFSFPTGS